MLASHFVSFKGNTFWRDFIVLPSEALKLFFRNHQDKAQMSPAPESFNQGAAYSPKSTENSSRDFGLRCKSLLETKAHRLEDRV